MTSTLTNSQDPDLPGPASYILNEYQLLENGYPVPGQQECANYFRFSKKETNKTGEEHILAVDCEMVFKRNTVIC